MAAADAPPDTGPGRRWIRILVGLLVVGLVVAALAAGAVAVAFHRIASEAVIPTADELAIEDPTVLTDTSGDTVTTLQPAAVRRNITFDDLPDHVWQAVLAAEDRAFFDHPGFSARGIVRAAWANVTGGERVQGASTIHQQYVSYAIADIDDSYLGKFREVATAYRLNESMSKEQVLEQYLNSVPFGRSANGIEAAARTYFDTGAEDLSVHESAVLAGMMAAPTAFDPARNPDRAAGRRDFVARGMETTGALTSEEAEELIGSELPPLREAPLFEFDDNSYFVDAVRRELTELLDDEDRDPMLGLRVHTTLDQRAQSLALETIEEHLEGRDHSASVVTVDSATGAVEALVGGRDFGEQQYNVAIERASLRSPGSAFKTFALAALVDQGFDPDATRLTGPAEMTFEFEDGREDYEVRNFGDAAFSRLTVREATVRSVNTAYVQLSEELGWESVTDMATRLGVDSDLSPVPSAVLGSQGVTPLEMANAYATLAAEGVRHAPHLVTSIETHDGEVLYEHEPDGEEVLDPGHAAVITDVLSDAVTQGTGTGANIGRPVAGKTGTTNDSRDAWFVGYTPSQATAVWVGNLDNSPMGGVTGGSIPAPLWGDYVSALLDGTDPQPFPTPSRAGLTELRDLRPPEPEPEPEPEPAPEPSPPTDDEDDDGEPEDGDDENGDAGDADDDGAPEDENGEENGEADDENGDADDDGAADDDGNDEGAADDGNDGDGNDGDGNGNGGNGNDGGNGGDGDANSSREPDEDPEDDD